MKCGTLFFKDPSSTEPLKCNLPSGHGGHFHQYIPETRSSLTERLVESLEAIADAQTVLAMKALTGSSVDEGTAGARVRERFAKKAT